MNNLLITNKSRNPNDFNAKLGKSVLLPPFSEIAVEGLKFSTISTVNIDESNNKFVLLFGQADMECLAPTQASPKLNFLPPELLEIESGLYNLLSYKDAKYDMANSHSDNSIMSGIVKALSKSKYWMWGFDYQYPTTVSANIGCFVKAHSIGPLSWQEDKITINDVAANPGVSPGYNQLTDTDTEFFAFTQSRVPLPYHSDVKTATAENPNYGFAVILPSYTAAERMDRFFVGYTNDKENGITVTDKINNNLLFSVELDDSNNLIVVQRNIQGDIIEITDSNVTYDGANLIGITFKPLITNVLANNSTDMNRQLLQINISDGTTNFFKYIDIDSTYFPNDYYLGICSKSVTIATGAAGAITVETQGCDENRFDSDSANKLGNISHNMVNIMSKIFMSRILNNTELDDNVKTITNYRFSKFTQQANCNYLNNHVTDYYTFDGSNPAVYSTNININYQKKFINLCLNIDNLPLDSHYCDPEKGKIQKRIYTLYSKVDIGESTIIYPTNLNFMKLHNKTPLNINNLQIRFSNLDGSTSDLLEGTVYISLLIKENTKIKNKAYKDNYNIDNTINNFELSNKII